MEFSITSPQTLATASELRCNHCHERALEAIPIFPGAPTPSGGVSWQEGKVQFLVQVTKRQPGATQNLLQLFIQPEREGGEKKCFPVLYLWGGRKVNYPHGKKKKMLNKGTGVPLGTLIHQQLPNQK